MTRPRTSLNVTADQMAALRELAASLGFYITRGPGTGDTGNVTALMGRLADAYAERPVSTRQAISNLIGQTP